MRKLQPPVFFLAALILMAAAHFLVRSSSLFAFPWNLFGIALIMLGIALYIPADRSFKQHATTVKVFKESSSLITTGVFAFSRNPMYLGMVLMLGGVAVLFGSATSWIIIPVFALFLDRACIRAEESMLVATFGTEFQAHRERVRRWV